MFASGDPLNVALAIIWSTILLGCLALTWYAYVRWKMSPDDSLSHNIALWLQTRGPLVGVAADASGQGRRSKRL
ncbi:MAG TPA: hypothetical protein VL175_07355 [Pirellulales bacterium]|jgi:hypothetical protein|nr:hypothetical protein [Pirellulales bacterium]